MLENSGNVLKQTFLFGDMSLSPCDNSKILNTTIDFILATKRFDKQLFKGKLYLLTTNKEIIWRAWLFVFFQAVDIYIYIYIYYILYIKYILYMIYIYILCIMCYIYYIIYIILYIYNIYIYIFLLSPI